MSLELLGFIILSAGLLASATVVIIARNPIHSAISLIVSFFFLAGLYLMLNANFVAVIQVLVYAGAIMVLFLFVIMLLNLSDDELGESRWNLHKILGSLAVVVLVGALIWAIVGAQTTYLGSPGAMRSTVFNRLAKIAGQRGFTSQAEQQKFIVEYSKLRTASLESMRLKHGTPAARESACHAMSAFSNEINPTLCNTEHMQTVASGVANSTIAAIDRKLLELEAEVDANPVPAEWRGEKAERIPGMEPSRYERAVLLAVDIVYATRIDQTADVVANRVLTFDQQSSLNMLARSASDRQSTDRSMAEVRALSALAPGERIRVSIERAKAVEAMAKEGDAVGADVDQFVDIVGKLRNEHQTVTTQILSNLRAGRRDLVLQTLGGLIASTSAMMTAEEQDMVQEILRDMTSGVTARVMVTTEPAIYNEDEFGSVESVGRQLFTKYLLPFEVTSVLLLVAIIGAVVIAKRRI